MTMMYYNSTDELIQIFQNSTSIMSIMCNDTCNRTTVDPLSLIDGEYYKPELVFDYLYIDGVRANDYIIDWMELVWNGYFAIFFGVLGSQLSRCKQFVFQLRVFGFYGIWTKIRTNPGFIDAVIFESLLRCFLSAGLAAITVVMINEEAVVELYTIITVGSGHLINIVDPYFRREGDCKDIGPPTPEFPYGVWIDCENWDFAYAVTWINSLFVYVMCLGCLLVAKFLKDRIPCMDSLKRMSSHIAVSMVATNAGCTFLSSLKRRYKIEDDYFDLFLQWSYYILLGSFFLVQEFVHFVWRCREKQIAREMSLSITEISTLVRSNTWRLQSYFCCAVKGVSTIFWVFSMPLYLPDQGLKWIIRKIIKINTKRLEKEEMSGEIERKKSAEEYWKKVTESPIEVEMVVGGPSSAKATPESKLGIEFGPKSVDLEEDVDDDVEKPKSKVVGTEFGPESVDLEEDVDDDVEKPKSKVVGTKFGEGPESKDLEEDVDDDVEKPNSKVVGTEFGAERKDLEEDADDDVEKPPKKVAGGPESKDLEKDADDDVEKPAKKVMGTKFGEFGVENVDLEEDGDDDLETKL